MQVDSGSAVAPFERLLEVTRDILEETELAPALESIARGFRDVFHFHYVTIVAAETAGGELTRRVLIGYDDDVIQQRLGERVERHEILSALEPSYLVFENCFFMPAERELPWERAIFADDAPIDRPRESPDRWHALDALILVLPDQNGEMLGYLSVDGPLDGRIPTTETMRSMQLFVNLLGLALANSRAHAAELERNRLLEANHDRLRHEATHDALTGLPNRQYLSDRLTATLREAAEFPDTSYAVLFVDLDEFKSINDSLGHEAGDRVLVEVARRLRATIEPGDFVARLGGDEFAVVLTRRPGYMEIVTCVDAINRAMLEPHDVEQAVFTTASIGIALITAAYTRIEDVLRDADTAMYYAKTLGRARYALFDPHMHTAATQRLALTTDLRLAIESSQFSVVYQPIVSLEDERIVEFEALVRWQHPQSGEMMPGDFINLAEDVGLIVGIGRFVFAESLARLHEWQTLVPGRRLGIAVNLAVQEILQPDLPQFIRNNLERFEIDPRDVTLEITESAILRTSALASGALARLRAIGVRLSIDDFGTGYSSLRYLQQFPVDTIKIDRSFVGGSNGELSSASIVKMLVELGASYGVRVVAEGIETPQQLEGLRALNCRYGQGYYFAQPLDPEWVDAALTQNTRETTSR